MYHAQLRRSNRTMQDTARIQRRKIIIQDLIGICIPHTTMQDQTRPQNILQDHKCPNLPLKDYRGRKRTQLAIQDCTGLIRITQAVVFLMEHTITISDFYQNLEKFGTEHWGMSRGSGTGFSVMINCSKFWTEGQTDGHPDGHK